LDNLYIDEIFGNNIRTYLPKYKTIEFGAITPKGNHLTVNIAAETIVNYGTTALAIKRHFVQHPQIQKILNDYKYGKIIRKLTIQASHHNLLKYIINYAKRNKTFETALYNAVSANRLYKDIILCTLRNLVS